MVNRVREFISVHRSKFSVLFVALIASVWLLGPVVVNLVSVEVAMGISFTVTLVMLGALLDQAGPQGGITEIFERQADANSRLIDFIRGRRIENVRMIEYAGASVREVIEELLRRRISVELLLQHPDHAVSSYQRDKIIHQIRTARELTNFDLLSVSYYRDTAGFRGRRFDDRLLSVGWYTYDRRRDKSQPEVWGHTNPVMVVAMPSRDGITLAGMFDEVFRNLKENSEPFDEIESRYTADPQASVGEVHDPD